MNNILVFDTQNPLKKAFEVSQAWVDIMSRKEPGRYQVKSAPQVLKIPKKKVAVVGKKDFIAKQSDLTTYQGNQKVESEKEIVSLEPLKVGEPSKRIKAKSKASTAD